MTAKEGRDVSSVSVLVWNVSAVDPKRRKRERNYETCLRWCSWIFFSYSSTVSVISAFINFLTLEIICAKQPCTSSSYLRRVLSVPTVSSESVRYSSTETDISGYISLNISSNASLSLTIDIPHIWKPDQWVVMLPTAKRGSKEEEETKNTDSTNRKIYDSLACSM